MQSPVYVSEIIGIDFSPKELDDIDAETSKDENTMEEEPEPEIGEKEEEKEEVREPVYVYYISKDTLVKANKEDPDDITEIKKTGSSDMALDQEKNVLYYIYLNRFIIRSPLDGGQLEYIVRTPNKITSLVYHPPSRKLYFTDSSGSVESYDTVTKARAVLYRGRNNPAEINLSPPDKMDPEKPPVIIWKESDKIFAAPSSDPSDDKIETVGQSPEIKGSEESISRTPKGDVYYFIREDRVYKFIPEIRKVDMITNTPATSVLALPTGALFTTPDNKVGEKLSYTHNRKLCKIHLSLPPHYDKSTP